MIKTCLIISIMIVSFLIGFCIKNYLNIRHVIYVDFKDLIQSIKTEINFLKTEKIALLKNQKCQSKHSQEFVNKYIISGCGGSAYLKQNEIDELNNLFNTIGKNDVDGELNNLEFFELKINKKCKETEEKLNKYGVFSIKMSIVLGALIAIILI